MENDIPTKILLETKDIVGEYLTNIYHKSIENQSFPLSLKKADVIPSHKQLDSAKNSNLGENWICFDNMGFPIYFAIRPFTF